MNVGLGLDARDPLTGDRLNAPAWRIYDAQYAARYRHALPTGPELIQADSLRALAERAGIDADGLEREAARVTRFARSGHDEDFGRGSHGWDPGRNGDPRVRPNSCLGTIERAPFYAFPMPVSFLGTKGGPRTNAFGQVLDCAQAADRRPVLRRQRDGESVRIESGRRRNDARTLPDLGLRLRAGCGRPSRRCIQLDQAAAAQLALRCAGRRWRRCAGRSPSGRRR